MKTDSEYDVMSVLKIRHEIPHHSREFQWSKDKHISTVVQEIINDWCSDALHWLGFLIIYDDGSELPGISDGQHRLTICYLMIRILAELLGTEEPLQWISHYGTTSILGTQVPPHDQVILDRYGWTRFPNIHSVFDNDFEALGNILNGITPENRLESKLYDAYDTIKELLTPVTDYRSLLQFIYNDIKMTRVVITDWDFAQKTFNSLNNIKVVVPASNLLRNIFIRSIGVHRSKEVHSIFCTWKRTHPKFEAFIHLMFSMYKRRLLSNEDYQLFLASNPDLGPTAFTDFQNYVTKGHEYIRQIEQDRFGRILMLMISGYEVMGICLLPLAFQSNGMTDAIRALIRALVSFGIRADRKVSFNPMKAQGLIRPLIMELFAGTKTVTEVCTKIRGLLQSWLQVDANVAARLATEKFAKTAFGKVRPMLLYLAEAQDSHESQLNHSIVHIDHIYAKTEKVKDKAKAKAKGKEPTDVQDTPVLANPDNIHRLGNFTPLLGPNSEAGMKGNSSLSNKPFSEKVDSYRKSNIAMTRDVAAKYGTGLFLDAQIEERSQFLAAQLDALTKADLMD